MIGSTNIGNILLKFLTDFLFTNKLEHNKNTTKNKIKMYPPNPKKKNNSEPSYKEF